jgi:hypothetical protein
MNNVKGSFTLCLVATLGLACDGTGLGTQGPGTGGRFGQSSASGGAPGSGGAGAGGVLAAGGAWGSGGVIQGSGGIAAGGTTSAGGSTVLGGRGGANAGGGTTLGGRGGSNTTASGGSTVVGGRGGSNAGGSTAPGGRGGSGAGGTTTCATLVACPAIGCLYGEIPNPDPCGCPLCAGPDAGIVKDAAADACLALPCAYPLCGPGQVLVTPDCGCPTCVAVDGGQSDVVACPPVACPAIACVGGMVPNPNDPCACPICASADAAVDTRTDGATLACVNLDECSCVAASDCRIISDACYCPFPQCGSGACVCGGGKFIGCAPTNLSSCADAKTRVGTMCPQLKGATFDNLCSQANTACITKCLNDVTSCGDVGCAFCEACDCATDNFLTCVGKCSSGVTTQ